jgi:hypothetical protein
MWWILDTGGSSALESCAVLSQTDLVSNDLGAQIGLYRR